MNEEAESLQFKIETDYNDYLAELMKKDKSVLIEDAEKIALMQNIMAHLPTDDRKIVRFLSQFQHPLIMIYDNMLEMLPFTEPSESIQINIEQMMEDDGFHPPEQRGVKLC
ncbi:hypothetical protein A7X67_13305 [Clostridium sp. W14A]|nr:hypothetical protein A7X67_13305 [Clostridium sp. W14A]